MLNCGVYVGFAIAVFFLSSLGVFGLTPPTTTGRRTMLQLAATGCALFMAYMGPNVVNAAMAMLSGSESVVPYIVIVAVWISITVAITLRVSFVVLEHSK